MSRIDSFNVGASPVGDIRRGSEDYSRRNGIYVPPAVAHGYGRVAITRAASQQIGRTYDALPDFDQRAIPAYRQMREELGRQYDHITKPRSKGGMGIDIEVSKEDPYGFAGEKPKADYSNWDANRIVGEMRDDVQNSNRMRVYATASTGEHPFFSNDENDMFRGVHDVFGHLASGRGIDMHGEEAAYQKHSAMFSPLARQALASETRGQNSSLHLNGQFGPQKVALLPEHMQSAQFARTGGLEQIRQSALDARAENRKQGI